MTGIKANARVKEDKLKEVYGWTDNQRLLLTQKLQELDKDKAIDLYQAYNIETKQWAGVTSEDILFIDEEIAQTKPTQQDAYQIIVEGPKLHIFK